MQQIGVNQRALVEDVGQQFVRIELFGGFGGQHVQFGQYFLRVTVFRQGEQICALQIAAAEEAPLLFGKFLRFSGFGQCRFAVALLRLE